MIDCRYVLVAGFDEADARRLLQELSRAGLDAAWQLVGTDEEFRRGLAARPDVILANAGGVKFTVDEAMNIVSAEQAKVPLIVLLQPGDGAEAARFLHRGAADVIPLDHVEVLAPAVRRAIEQSRLRDERHAQDESIRRLVDVERRLRMELDHRVRNNLTSLLSLIEMTRRSTDDVHAFAESLSGRVRAMARVHALLTKMQFDSLSLRSVLESVTPNGIMERLSLSGPDVPVASSQATALGIVFHELMTNSLRHGALRTPTGRVRIEWRADAGFGPGRACTVLWIELGGPPIAGAPSPGLGMDLAAGLAGSDLQGAIFTTYAREGARHELRMRLDEERAPHRAHGSRQVNGDAPMAISARS